MTLSKCLQVLDQFSAYYTKDIYDNLKEEILNSNQRVIGFFRSYAKDHGKARSASRLLLCVHSSLEKDVLINNIVSINKEIQKDRSTERGRRVGE